MVERLRLMSRLTVDSATVAKLRGLSEPVDLCDEQGHVVGHFVPYGGGIPSAALELDIPEKELDRRAANFQGRPLDDLIAEWERRK
jgi:hypothetical protein